MQKIELLLCPAVAGVAVNAPPVSPASGSCHLVGAAPTGAWAGHPHAIAGWTGNGWRFVEPVDGLQVRMLATGQGAMFRGGVWEIGLVEASEIRVGGDKVVGSRRPAIPSPSGGATSDTEARAAIGAILAALRAHGLIAT